MTIEGCALSHERCTAILISDAIEGCALYNERCTAILISDAIEGCALSNEQRSKGVSLLCDPINDAW